MVYMFVIRWREHLARAQLYCYKKHERDARAKWGDIDNF